MEKKKFSFTSITDNNEKARMQLVFAKELENKDIAALNHLLSSDLGRWFLIRLLNSTSYQGRSFTGNSATFFNEGRRAVGIELNERVAALGIEAVKLKQQGELEYIEYQEHVIEVLRDKELMEKKE